MNNKEKIALFIKHTGYITTGIAQEDLHVRSPNQPICDLKPVLGLKHYMARANNGKRIKVHYTGRNRALRHIRDNGLEVIA